MREEGVALEHRVDVAAVRRRLRDVLAVEQDPPARRALEARDHAQRRRLAATRRPDHREELAGRHVQVDAVDGDDVGTERLDELLEADFTLHGALDLQAGGDRFGAFGAGEPPVDDEYERERPQRDRK